MSERVSSPWLPALFLAFVIAGCGGAAPVDRDLAAPDLQVLPDLATAAAFGDPCRPDDSCAEGLVCLPGPAGGSFCTRTCPAGQSKRCPETPEGTAAYCLVTDVNPAGDKACAFLCAVGGKSYECPGELLCAAEDDPPGSGQRLCLPPSSP